MTRGALLEIEGVRKTFSPRGGRLATKRERSAVPALDAVSLAVERHETLALVGESGSGKSTLARVIVRLTEPDEGRVLLDGEDLLAMDHDALRRARRRIQMVFQDPYSSLNPRFAVGSAITEPALIHGRVRRGEERAFAERMLDRVGLSSRTAARLPRELSGGQRQRVAIARALAVEPEVLIADEVVSALDVSVQAQILNLFEDLRAQLGLTMLFIAHQLPVVAHLADRVAVMYLGRIVELGAPEDLFQHPGHPYTANLVDAQPGRHRRGREAATRRRAEVPVEELLGRGCSYRDRCPLATAVCRDARPPMVELAVGQRAACHHAGELPVGTRAADPESQQSR
jgi:peptide/nickel transport system ATP-binding protein